MKINEYKDSVGSIKLSDGFKQQLKEKMLLEAQNRDETKKPKQDITVSVGKMSKKYSKYAALAACLLLAVSAAGVLSASQNAFKSKTTEDFAKPEIMSEGIMANMDTDSDSSAADVNAAAEVQESSVVDDGTPLPAPQEVEEDIPVEEPVEATEEEDTEEVVESDDVAADTPEEPVVAEPRTSSDGYSTDPSPDYDGSYYGIDYVINDVVGSAQYNAVVVDSIDVEAKMIPGNANTMAPQAPESAAPTEMNPDAPVENGVGDGAAESEETLEGGDTVDEEEDDSVEEEEPIPASSNETVLEGYGSEDNSAGAVTFEDLTSGESKKYYDIRDGVIAKLDNVGLIRFSIVEGYDSVEEIAKNSSGLRIDPSCQTLYRINVTYDYFNSEDANAERLLINTGNSRYQLIGRPAMEGEYIAVVTETEDGILTPVPELIYAVHNVSGLDIAYHLYSDSGFMIDPGSTNMGILPEEVAVVNSTANNPEIYTQKAAVRELTFYLRRNILRMEPNVLDFSQRSEQEEAAPDEPAEEAPRELIRAVFPSGKLRLTSLDESFGEIPAEVGNYTSDEISSLRVNGIGVGDDMADALKAFFLTKYKFTPDAKITLCASDDGGWFVIVTFSENTVSKIEVFE